MKAAIMNGYQKAGRAGKSLCAANAAFTWTCGCIMGIRSENIWFLRYNLRPCELFCHAWVFSDQSFFWI